MKTYIKGIDMNTIKTFIAVFLFRVILFAAMLGVGAVSISVASAGSIPRVEVLKTHTNVYFPETLEDRKAFDGVAALLLKAKKGDKVVFYIQGYGGRVNTMQYIIYHMENTKADLSCEIMGNVYSAHAMIAISCPKIRMIKNGFFMFHGVQMNRQDNKLNKAFNTLTKDILSRVLSRNEVDYLLEDSKHVIYIQNKNMKWRLK